MVPIANDVRRNIIEAKKRNESNKNIIKWFNVSQSSVDKIWKRYRVTGSYEPQPYPGRVTEIFTDEINDKIISKIKETPDITQQDLIDELKLNISQPGLSKHLKKLGFTLKKRLSMQQEYKKKK